MESLVTDKIFADTKTKIHFMRGGMDQLNQMLASGQMPDIITLDDTNKKFAETASRWAVPLNQLADIYDPYFYQVVKPDSLAWYTNEVGDVYAYPSFSNSYEDFFAPDSPMIGELGFLIRQDIYETIGRPNMQSPAGFLQALRDVRQYYPEIEPFVIQNLPSAGAAEWVLMSFLSIPKTKNGQYYERIYDEDYLIWIDTFRQAHKEGLISSDNFAWQNGYFDEGMSRGEFFAVLTNHLMSTGSHVIRNFNRNPQEHYIAIDGPANRNLDPPSLTQANIDGWTLTLVSQQAKDKERVIQLITYLLSQEGQLTQALGVEGISYFRDEDGLYRFTPEYAQLRATDIDRFERETNLGKLWMLQDEMINLRYSDTLPPEMHQIFAWTKGKQKPQFATVAIDPELRTSEAKILNQYNEERNSVIVRMLRADSKEEMLAILEEFKKQTDRMDEVFASMNEKIASNLTKLESMGYNYEPWG